MNGEHYKHGYYLADGIYPSWVVFVKAYPYPVTDKKIRFKAAQESARNDVERAFGVLKGCWDILKMPARAMAVKKTKNIMHACIILHNMILKDEGAAISHVYQPDSPTDEVSDQEIIHELRDAETHHQLRSDLIDYIEHVYILSQSQDT